MALNSDDAVGYMACAVAVLCFGSNYVPVKSTPTADGLWFALVMTFAVWLEGCAVQVFQGNPQFEPFAMLGGALWATGNMTVVPIVKTIGLGLGLLVWGLTCMLVGWASGHFGILGVTPEPALAAPWLNYCGVTLAAASLGVYAMITSEVAEGRSGSGSSGGGGGGDADVDVEEGSVSGENAEFEPLLAEHREWGRTLGGAGAGARAGPQVGERAGSRPALALESFLTRRRALAGGGRSSRSGVDKTYKLGARGNVCFVGEDLRDDRHRAEVSTSETGTSSQAYATAMEATNGTAATAATTAAAATATASSHWSVDARSALYSQSAAAAAAAAAAPALPPSSIDGGGTRSDGGDGGLGLRCPITSTSPPLGRAERRDAWAAADTPRGRFAFGFALAAVAGAF